uniref:Uncharacterized protein n=1 Tax=Arundo donax TaxID=35708 RepID=A0A0A9CSC1_ARUDO
MLQNKACSITKCIKKRTTRACENESHVQRLWKLTGHASYHEKTELPVVTDTGFKYHPIASIDTGHA